MSCSYTAACCTYHRKYSAACGKPESAAVHVQPNESMEGGRHVFRTDEPRRQPDHRLRDALEAEWYNGNLDEKAYRRLCKVAGVKAYPSAGRA